MVAQVLPKAKINFEPCVRLRISWSSELAGNYSRSRTLSALRCKKVSGFLINVLRGERLFVDIFRVGS